MGNVILISVKVDGVETRSLAMDLNVQTSMELLAQSHAQYELVDVEAGVAPDRVRLERVGNDLRISLEDRVGQITIRDYYNEQGLDVVGVAEDGQLYSYIPGSGELSEYLPNLAD